jgi:transposase
LSRISPATRTGWRPAGTRAQAYWKQEIARLGKLQKAEIAVLEQEIRKHDDLAERLDLIASVDGIGLKTAIVILVRIPEIGRLSGELWRYDTARTFDTVNKVAAKGGSIMAPGPTVAGSMVFVGSGYSTIAGQPGNVLLAFAPD